MCSPKRDIMRRHNKATVSVLVCLCLCVVLAGSALAQSQSQQSSGQQNPALQPTPLPSDIDPSDPALPVWLRPATPPSAKTASKGPQPAVNEDIVPTGP